MLEFHGHGGKKTTLCTEIKIKQKKHSRPITQHSDNFVQHCSLPVRTVSTGGISGGTRSYNWGFGCKWVKFQLWLNCPFKISLVLFSLSCLTEFAR